MRIRFPILTCLGLLMGGQAFAFDFFENMAIRGGLGVGRLEYREDVFPTHTTSWDASLGFEFNRYLAVEAGRLFGGSASHQDTIEDPTLRVTDDLKIRSNAWYASTIGSLPVSDEVSFYARLGYLHWTSTLHLVETLQTLDISGNIISTQVIDFGTVDDKGNEPLYGAGIAIAVDSGLLRLEYDMTKILDLKVRNISLSVVWRFKI